MKAKFSLALLSAALLVPVGTAEAQVKLKFPVAKAETKRLADPVCAQVPGCYRTRVPQCTRRSLRRVDCLALFDFRDGVSCSMTVINRLDSRGLLHQVPKAIRCA